MGCGNFSARDNMTKDKSAPLSIRDTTITKLSNQLKIKFPSLGEKDKKKFKVEMDIKEKQCFMPLWVNKGSYIKFRVKGQWRLGPMFPWCSSEGFPSVSKQRINYCSLLATIGGSESFVVKDNQIHLAPSSGPLSFWIHLPKLKMNEIDPSGLLVINVYDAEQITLKELCQKLGWVDSKKETVNKKTNLLSDMEYELVMNINDLRRNPSLFYQLFIANSARKIINTKEYLDKKDHKVKKELVINENVNMKLKELVYIENYRPTSAPHRTINKRVAMIGVNNLQKKIEATISTLVGVNLVKVILKLMKNTNNINLVLGFLLDDILRDVLFDSRFQSIGAKIIKNYAENNDLIILIFVA